MRTTIPFETTLKNSIAVQIRAIGPDDRHLLSEGFEKLSSESRYMRFLGAHSSLTEAELDAFTAPNNLDHFAIGAMHGPHPVATARFAVLNDPQTAELAITIIDDYQAIGLGKVLLHTLAAVARAQGITDFLALVHSENQSMRNLLAHFGATRIRMDGSEQEMRLDLNGKINAPLPDAA